MGLSGRYGSVITNDRCADCNARIKLKSIFARAETRQPMYQQTYTVKVKKEGEIHYNNNNQNNGSGKEKIQEGL